MSDKQATEHAQAWPFAPSYEASYSSLPPSQLRAAVKRLSERRRNPLPADALTQENPEVEGVLAAVKKAYLAIRKTEPNKPLPSRGHSSGKQGPITWQR